MYSCPRWILLDEFGWNMQLYIQIQIREIWAILWSYWSDEEDVYKRQGMLMSNILIWRVYARCRSNFLKRYRNYNYENCKPDKNVGIGDIVESRNADHTCRLADGVEHGDMGRGHRHDALRIPFEDLPAETLGNGFPVTGDEQPGGDAIRYMVSLHWGIVYLH